MRNKNKLTPTLVRLTKEDFKLLKKLSYLTERSCNSLMVEGIKKMIEEQRKVLTNSDIVIS